MWFQGTAQSLGRETDMEARKRNTVLGNSLAVQWLGLHAFTAVVWVRSLVRELRSHKLCSAAKKQKQTNKKPSARADNKPIVRGA